MKADALVPSCRARIKFEYSDLGLLPQKPGCYVLLNFEGDVLYIGKSENLRRRTEDHLSDSHKTAKTAQGYVIWISFLVADEVSQIGMLERGWANQHELAEGRLPILNSVRPAV